VLVGEPDPVAVEVGLDDFVGFGDVVGLVDLVALTSTVGLGVVDGDSTVLVDGADGVRCSVLREGAGADELRCSPVLLPPSPAWPWR
jgi:hypothetical protein